jgi:hypothetical protein
MKHSSNCLVVILPTPDTRLIQPATNVAVRPIPVIRKLHLTATKLPGTRLQEGQVFDKKSPRSALINVAKRRGRPVRAP